ncbi:hypothetical protein QEW_3487 [Clostridioides difficile CD160]|nr:hypothetical protein QEW_3487 [Clostridioides difficile CD160]
MAREVFTVKMTPLEAQKMIEENMDADIIFTDAYNLGDGKFILITAFDRYYVRSSSNAGLLVICENTTEETLVKVVSTGSGTGLFQIDWGAGSNFTKRIRKILNEYIIKVIDIDKD